LVRFGESAIDFELVVWSMEMHNHVARFRSDLNFLIDKHLRAAGIEIPFPQRDLHIRSGALKVETAAVGKRV
jgi:potassium-dependent mechanosensitive channel